MSTRLSGRSVTGVSRRRFLAALAAAAAAPYIVPGCAMGKNGRAAPSERIGIASIGLGSRGNNHLDTFLSRGETQIVAVCDPFESKCQAAKGKTERRYAADRGAGSYAGCATATDFRAVLAHKDVDAVVIASPENWHVLQASAAVKAGKDVYCEKALSLTVAEGRSLVDTVRRTGRILQVGIQQRSDRRFRQACELARNGYLGKVHTIKVSVPGGRALPNAEPKSVPPGLDYEMWLGPAAWTPYNDLKCTFNWYFIYDYCIGWIQSWGVHHIDIALWGVPGLAASTIDVEGDAVFPQDGIANTSVTWSVKMTAPDGTRVIFSDESTQPHGVRFEGDKGWVHVVRGNIWAEPASLLTAVPAPGDERLYESLDHHTNFLQCIRTRQEPAAPVEAGHRATTLTIVADIATRLGRKLTWDWKAERFPADEPANRMLSRAMRSPWTL